MATHGGGGEVDGERNDFKRLKMISGRTPTPVSFVFTIIIELYEFV